MRERWRQRGRDCERERGREGGREKKGIMDRGGGEGRQRIKMLISISTACLQEACASAVAIGYEEIASSGRQSRDCGGGRQREELRSWCRRKQQRWRRQRQQQQAKGDYDGCHLKVCGGGDAVPCGAGGGRRNVHENISSSQDCQEVSTLLMFDDKTCLASFLCSIPNFTSQSMSFDLI